MLDQLSQARRRANDATAADPVPLVLGAGVAMILAQVAFRAWALFPSWFYVDDYLLLDQAQRPLSVDYLLTPFNTHLMPGGRMWVWLVAHAGALDWGWVATSLVVFQALVSLAALWMLVGLFGVRWGVLAPLALYLTAAMTLPGLMWWSAALIQLGVQAAFFLAVGAWVRYLRGRRTRWLVATFAALGLGLVFEVKTLVVLPVLVFVLLAYFTEGSWRQRLGMALRRYWPAAVVGAVLPGLYLAYYVTQVPQPFTDTKLSLVGPLTGNMIGTAFSTGVLGGPWRWSSGATGVTAAPPTWAQSLAWVVLALVVAYGFLRRRNTGRAWVLLVGYLAVGVILVVNSRAPQFGAGVGLDYRFVTDALCATMLCVGLAFLPLRGAVQSSHPRVEPLLTRPLPAWGTVGIVGALCLSGTFSSVAYIHDWQDANVSKSYVRNLAQDLRGAGAVDLADEAAGARHHVPLTAPDNTVGLLVGLMDSRASFPDTSSRLVVVGGDGHLRTAVIAPGIVAAPGDRPGCGRLVKDRRATLSLGATAFRYVWWIRVGYLASQASPIRLSAGDSVVRSEVQAGVHSLYFQVDGTFDEISIDGLDEGTSLCVDAIEVGTPSPGEPLT